MDQRRRSRWGYFLYDFANSGYVVVFGTFLLPIAFKDRLLADDPRADFYWGACISAAVIAAAVLAPLVGYAADRLRRRSVLAMCVVPAVVGAAAVSLLAARESSAPLLVALMFVGTHSLYVLSVAVCDSYLSHLGEDREGTSSFAWGFGYLGGVVCLVLVLAVQGASVSPTTRGFVTAAVFFAAFAALSLALLPTDAGPPQRLKLVHAARAVAQPRLLKTLVAFWLINEGVVTVMFFSAVFARETLQLDLRTIGGLYVAVQLLAFPGTWAMGRVARRWGTARTILGTATLWIVLLLGLASATTLTHFAALSLGSALVIGSTQALMRAHYSRLYPDEAAGLSFGLYTLVAKSSSVVGPLVFGLVASGTGNQRIAVLATVVPIVLGAVLFAVVCHRRAGDAPREKEGDQGPP